MENEVLLQEIARLESVNDHLATEIANLDDLLRQTGFPEGIASLKEAAHEMIENQEGLDDF